MDVAASLVAFITIGVQSAKTIHDILSAIKDGPDVVGRATRDVQRLSMILKAMESESSIGKTRGPELRQHLQECTDDLTGYVTQLGKLTVSDKERRLGKLWKKLRTVISEKDLSIIQSSVASHITHLNLHLQVRQVDSSFELRKELQVLSQTIHTAQSKTEGREIVTFGRLSSIDQRISSMYDVLGKIGMALGEISTSRECRETYELVKRLADQFTNLRPAVEAGDNDYDLATQESFPSQDPFVDLQRSVSGLCDLVNREMIRMSGQQSFLSRERKVLDGILEIIECIRSPVSRAELTYVRMADNPLCYSYEEDYLQSIWNHLQPLSVAVLSASSVFLNTLPPRKSKSKEDVFSTHRFRFRQLTHVSIDIMFASLDIIISEKSKIPGNWTDFASHSKKGSGSEIREQDVSYSLSIIPKSLSYIMKLRLTQYNNPDGVIFGIPLLEINRMVPNNSPIFGLVERGEISNLQQLLIRGHASLRDHDEHGASLLQYASLNYQAKMCRFLIENGADIDYFAPIRSIMRRKSWINWTDMHRDGVYSRGRGRPGIELNSHEYEGHLECYKILLNAGADPTITLPQFDSALSSAFLWGQLEIMECFLDHGGLFIDLNCSHAQPERGEISLFQQYCYGGNFTSKGFQSLIKRGADIEARDELRRTCLHLCVSGPRFGDQNRQAQIEALIYLVRHGANISWKDIDGNSVSHTAYWESRAGDVWDVVLAELGQIVSKFRHDRQRRAKYTKNYTPADFMKIWQGKEDLCPYYHDDDLLALCQQFQSGSLDEWTAPGYRNYSDSVFDSSSSSGSDSDDSSDGGALINMSNDFED